MAANLVDQTEVDKQLAAVIAQLNDQQKPNYIGNTQLPMAVIQPFVGSNAGPVTLSPKDTHIPVSITPDAPAASTDTKTPTAKITSAAPVPTSMPGISTDAAPGTDLMAGVSDAIAKQLAPKVTSGNSVSQDLSGFKSDLNSLQESVNSLFGKTTADTQATQQAVSQSSSKSSSSGLGIVGDIIGAATSFIGWIICTELVAQNRMPSRWWIVGSKVFASYPEVVKQGYYLWAIPSVRHLRAHPFSIYSRFLCLIFNWRAENIAAHKGMKNARILYRGAAVTAVLYPLCFLIGCAMRVANVRLDAAIVYVQECK